MSLIQEHAHEIILATLVLFGSGTAIGVAISQPDTSPPQDHLVIAVDLSGTTPAENRCAAVDRLATRWLTDVPRGGTHLTLVASGDAHTGGQMRRVTSVALSPDNNPLTGGGVPNADRARFIDELGTACGALPSSDESPLKSTLEGAINLVRSGEHDCGADGVRCAVLFKTDGIETSDPGLRVALGLDRPREIEAAPLDNKDVDIVLCGLSDRQLGRRSSHRSSPSLQTLSDAWRPQFTQPDRVRLQAICAAETIAQQ